MNINSSRESPRRQTSPSPVASSRRILAFILAIFVGVNLNYVIRSVKELSNYYYLAADVNAPSYIVPTDNRTTEATEPGKIDVTATNNQTTEANEPGENCSITSNTTKLSFVHIPKTGGSTIEEAALHQASLLWGYFAWKEIKAIDNPLLWHIPPNHLPSLLEGRSNQPVNHPYEGHELFAVVRNPFSRVVSEIFYHCGLSNREHRIKQCLGNKTKVNKKIQETIIKQMDCINTENACYTKQTHWIPQWHFFYNRRSLRRQVRYLLHFENLSNDFDQLMHIHPLNISLSSQKLVRVTSYNLNATKKESSKFTGIADLEDETIRLIVELYRSDFEIGGYSLDINNTTSYIDSTMNKGSNGFWELPCQLDAKTVY